MPRWKTFAQGLVRELLRGRFLIRPILG